MISSAQYFRTFKIAVLMLTAFILVPAVAGAVLPGRNGRIAFTSGREGANDALARIYLRTVIGSSGGGMLSAPISPLGGQSRHASWSPDRTKIVFSNGTPGSLTTEDYDLFVKDMVSGSVTALDANEVGDGLSSDHPAWSPDGTRIAYEHQPTAASADRDIMVKTVGTSAPAVHLTTGLPFEFKPAWTPDSQTIYYAKTVTNPNPDYNIMRQPATGGTETGVLTASGADEYQPSISPDGTQICFTLQAPPGDTSTADIYVASLPTPGAFTLMSPDTTKGDINCTFSPDGTKIAYVNGVYSQGRLVMKPINDPAGQPVQLEDDMGSNNFDGNPDWAPDGSPDCPDSTVSTPIDTPVTIELECTDTGPAYERTDPNGFVANGGEPANGTTSDDAPLNNPSTVRYNPNPGFSGTDSIVFTSFDDFGFGTDKGTVTINVLAPPPPPVGKAKLVIKRVKPKHPKVKRGRTVKIKVTAKNSGKDVARNTRLCVTRKKAVKKALKPKGRTCQKLASLAPGKAKTRSFKLKATRKARKNHKYKIKFTLSAKATKSVSRAIKLKVR